MHLTGAFSAIFAAHGAFLMTTSEQGWTLLCNGVIVFDDSGELLPDGSVVAPRRVPMGPLAMAA
ncbi:DUF5999 family protein [Streptomyces sp. MI02-2A]|nr:MULTISPECIES: DUF5999 family protein [unclassified Streptomyces]MDX3260838.1 DUF5999 family protein [Streptomyces sp. MI02-2A]